MLNLRWGGRGKSGRSGGTRSRARRRSLFGDCDRGERQLWPARGPSRDALAPASFAEGIGLRARQPPRMTVAVSPPLAFPNPQFVRSQPYSRPRPRRSSRAWRTVALPRCRVPWRMCRYRQHLAQARIQIGPHQGRSAGTVREQCGHLALNSQVPLGHGTSPGPAACRLRRSLSRTRSDCGCRG